MAVIRHNVEANTALPTIWANTAIKYLRARIRLLNLVNRDSRDEENTPGQTIRINKTGALSVNDKSPGSEFTFQAPANTKVDLVLDKHKEVSWGTDNLAEVFNVQDAIDYVPDAIDNLVEQMEKDLMALYPEITNDIGTPGEDMSEQTLLDIKYQLNQQNCPENGRFLIVPDKDERALLLIDKFSRADARGDGGSALENGAIGRLHGLTTFSSNLVETTAGPPITHHAMAGQGGAITIGFRALPMRRLTPNGAAQEGNGGTKFIIVRDPETGVILRMMSTFDHKLGQQLYTIDALYGVKVIDDRRLVEVLT